MKEYTSPVIDVILVEPSDIITTSDGVNTPVIDDNDGVWDLNL